jgi:glutamine synthetase
MENYEGLAKSLELLKNEVAKAKTIKNELEQANFYYNKVFPLMGQVRFYADILEKKIPASMWPFPTYMDLLFKM